MNKWLKGNGTWCQSCRGTGRGKARDRIGYAGGTWCQFYDPCATCGGARRLPAALDDVIKNQVPASRPPAFHTCLAQTLEYGRSTATAAAGGSAADRKAER